MLFVHDHTFVKYNKKYYTTGSLNNKILNRYEEWFKTFKVFAYGRDASIADKSIINEGNLASDAEMLLYPKTKKITRLLRIIQDLRDKIKEEDGVISRMSFLGVIAVHFAKKYNKPYLIEMVADPWDSLWNHSLMGKIIAPIMYFLTKYYVSNAPVVLYVTSEYLQKKYPTNGDHLGISDVEIHTKDYLLEERLSKVKAISKDRLVLSTLANIDVKYKGQEFVIKALPKIIESYPKVTYKIYGAGNGSYLKNLVSKMGLENHVKFLGQISHTEVIKALKETDIYIQPSLQEGLPRSVVEAMSTGALIIGTNTGGIPELIKNNYIVKRKSSDEIVTKIQKLSLNDFFEAAKENHRKSKEFNHDILKVKRNQFYKSFAERYSV